MNTEKRRTRNLRVAAGLTDIDWADTFLTATRERLLPGFDVPAEAILLSEIDFLYRQSVEGTRTQMKSGAAKAVAEYTTRAYGSEVLRELAAIAAITRSTEAVPHLLNHIINLYPHLGRDDTPVFPVAVDLMSALGTFPRHLRVADLFRKLLFDDSVHFRFAGILATAVVRGDPQTFGTAVTRFYKQRLQGPQYFHDRTLMSALCHAVLPIDIEKTIEKMDKPVSEFIIYWGDEFDLLGDIFPPDGRTRDTSPDAHVRRVESYSTLKAVYTKIAKRQGSLEKIYVRSRRERHGVRIRREGHG